jgi:hypothetical protein
MKKMMNATPTHAWAWCAGQSFEYLAKSRLSDVTVRSRVLATLTNHRCHDKVTNCHSHGAHEEGRTPADLVEPQKSRDERYELDDVHDSGESELHVVPESELLKQGWRVVDELQEVLSALLQPSRGLSQ